MNEDVTSAAVFEKTRRRSGIARNDNRSAWRLETVPESVQLAMTNGERRHLYIRVLIDGAGLNLVHVHLVTCRILVLQPFGSGLNIRRVRF